MFQYGLIYLFGVFAFATVVLADRTTQPTNLMPLSSGSPNMPIIKYDGPLYQMSAEEIAAMLNATENGELWSAPEAMPRIEWTPGTVLDLGGGNSTLSKRRGAHQINLYAQTNCPSSTYVGGVSNFGCGGACVFFNLPLRSAWLYQQYGGRPFPTARLFPNQACAGSSYQDIGIENSASSGTVSCTNVDNCCGYWQSFYAYFNC